MSAVRQDPVVQSLDLAVNELVPNVAAEVYRLRPVDALAIGHLEYGPLLGGEVHPVRSECLAVGVQDFRYVRASLCGHLGLWGKGVACRYIGWSNRFRSCL